MRETIVKGGPPASSWGRDLVYGAGGELVGDSNPIQGWWASYTPHVAGEMMYLGSDSSYQFLHSNALGSTSMVTNQAGAVIEDELYYPWGQVWKGGASIFASMQPRDWASGLDPTLFRHYNSLYGRWMSPDLLGGDLTNPQSLNRYAYVTNNPLSFIDPLGLQGYGSCYTEYNSEVGSITYCWEAGGGSGRAGNPILIYGPGMKPGLVLPNGRPQTPCANSTLAAAGVSAQQQIATAQAFITAGKIGAGIPTSQNPVLQFFGGMFGYYEAVKTGGPNDIKNQPGPGYHNQVGVDAGNVSFGITCPYGAGFCQFAAGLAQTLSGHPDFSGTLATGFDRPSDNSAIKEGQAMRAAGCHE